MLLNQRMFESSYFACAYIQTTLLFFIQWLLSLRLSTIYLESFLTVVSEPNNDFISTLSARSPSHIVCLSWWYCGQWNRKCSSSSTARASHRVHRRCCSGVCLYRSDSMASGRVPLPNLGSTLRCSRFSATLKCGAGSMSIKRGVAFSTR